MVGSPRFFVISRWLRCGVPRPTFPCIFRLKNRINSSHLQRSWSFFFHVPQHDTKNRSSSRKVLQRKARRGPLRRAKQRQTSRTWSCGYRLTSLDHKSLGCDEERRRHWDQRPLLQYTQLRIRRCWIHHSACVFFLRRRLTEWFSFRLAVDASL